MKKLFLLILFMMLIPSISAYTICNSTPKSFNSSLITDNSFKLTWNNTDIQVSNIYKNNVLYLSSYTLNETVFTDLKSNSLYEIMLINGTCAYIKDVTTNPTSAQNINNYLNIFLPLLLAIGLTIVAVFLRSKAVMVLPTLIMAYGFVNSVNNHIGYQYLTIYGFGLFVVVIFLLAV